MTDVRLVYITAPSIECARQLAQQLLAQRLVACVNLLPAIESHYLWQNQVETSTEILMICKTTTSAISHIETMITQEHPYKIPCCITITPDQVLGNYTQWIHETLS